MSARIKVFHFGYNVFKLQTFLFLVNVQSRDMCGREARMRTNFWVDKGKWIAVDGALKRKKRVLSLLMFKALKWNIFPITVYKDVIFMRQFRQSATNRYQSISIYLLIVIENRYQSITTQILAIDGSSIIHINWLIDIDWYRLSNLSIGYPGIVRHMTSFVQKILVDSNQEEFAMKKTRKKDLVGIVTFDLIGVLPTNCIIYNGIPEFIRKPLMLTVI